MDDAARTQSAAPLGAAVVEHALSVTIDSLPPVAVESAKTFLLDCFGVAIVGSLTPESQRLPAIVAGWWSGDDASVWGREGRLPAPSAAATAP